jgi:hypothetical protein
MPEEILKMFSRLKQDADGIDFIDFLKSMSLKNYEEWKRVASDMNDIHKGKALVYDELIKLFEECDDKLNARNTTTLGGVI